MWVKMYTWDQRYADQSALFYFSKNQYNISINKYIPIVVRGEVLPASGN